MSSRPCTAETVMLILPAGVLPCDRWAHARALDPLLGRYRACFALLDWDLVLERDPTRPWPGHTPHPTSACSNVLLLNLCERHASITQVRAFLVEHPLLVLELGLRPVLDPSQPYGFVVERTVPCARWLRQQQRTLEHTSLQRLLTGTVHALQRALPGIVSATDVAATDVVLAEWTQTFNHQDSTCFPPLYADVSADAAFDAWHVYQRCAEQGAVAAVARHQRGPAPARTPEGHPICARPGADAHQPGQA
jgi:hypothetical protein